MFENKKVYISLRPLLKEEGTEEKENKKKDPKKFGYKNRSVNFASLLEGTRKEEDRNGEVLKKRKKR